MKRERKFLGELAGSFRARNSFFFKIPDMPHFKGAKFRFDIEKPFDAVATWAGISMAIEAKVITNYKKFGVQHLRPCQVKGLDAWSSAGGRAFVFVNLMQQARSEDARSNINRLFVFEWEALKAKGMYSKAELAVMPHYKRYAVVNPLDRKKRKYRFNIDEFLIEQGLKV